jgi:hypothetical protein
MADRQIHLRGRLQRLGMLACCAERFCRALGAPPARNLKVMHRLLNEPTVLEE